MEFEASECTVTCKQQLALPRLVVHILTPEGTKDVHFVLEGATVSFSDTKRVAGTISFTSDDPGIAEVDGSTIHARSAGTTTVTATFSPSQKFHTQKCKLQVIVRGLPVTLKKETTREKGARLTVPLRAFLPIESVPLPAVEPDIPGTWTFSPSSNLLVEDGRGPHTGVLGRSVTDDRLMGLDGDELTATFTPTDGAYEPPAAVSIPVCVKFLQEEDDRAGDLGKVDDFFNNRGAFEFCSTSNIPFPDMDYLNLCPRYFQNVISALHNPPQVPVCAKQGHLQAVVANARLPHECKASKDNGGCQHALDLFLRRAAAVQLPQKSASKSQKSTIPSKSEIDALARWVETCGVDVKCRDVSNRTALHTLAVSGTLAGIALAEILVRAASVVDGNSSSHEGLIGMRDGDGRDALEIAVDQGNVEFAAFLIRNGAAHPKDLLKNKYKTQSAGSGGKLLIQQWRPVIDAIVQAQTQPLKSDASTHTSKVIRGDLKFERDIHHLEGDADVLAIMQKNFKAASRPSLKSVYSQDPAFAQLMRTLTFTRMPECCTVAEVTAGLASYIKLLKGVPVSDALSDVLESPGYLRLPSAPAAIPVHRWVLAVAAHISQREGDMVATKGLLEQLQQLEPDKRLSAVEQKLLSASSAAAAATPKSEIDVLSEVFGKHDALTDKYDDATKGRDAKQLEPLNSIMDLIGLRNIKEAAIDMYSVAQDRERLRKAGKENSIVHSMMNYIFCGNPGCGKTESARLFAKVLVKADLRLDNYVEIKAQEAISQGSKDFAQMLLDSKIVAPKCADKGTAAPVQLAGEFRKNEKVEVQLDKASGQFHKATIIETPQSRVPPSVPPSGPSAKYNVRLQYDGTECDVELQNIRRCVDAQLYGGVIFIDDAHVLDPRSSAEGRAIFNDILRIAEDCRETVTIILAGRRSDIEQKLIAYNTCNKYASVLHFQHISFELPLLPSSPALIFRRHDRPFSCHEI